MTINSFNPFQGTVYENKLLRILSKLTIVFINFLKKSCYSLQKSVYICGFLTFVSYFPVIATIVTKQQTI